MVSAEDALRSKVPKGASGLRACTGPGREEVLWLRAASAGHAHVGPQLGTSAGREKRRDSQASQASDPNGSKDPLISNALLIIATFTWQSETF